MITPNVRPTGLDVLRRHYVYGDITTDEFEAGAAALAAALVRVPEPEKISRVDIQTV